MLKVANTIQENTYVKNPTKINFQQLDVLRMIMYYVRSIHHVYKSSKEIQEDRMKNLQKKIRKMQYERKPDEDIQRLVEETDQLYKLRITDPAFDEEFFFSNNRDVLTLKILSCFLAYRDTEIDERHLISYIERRSLASIKCIKESDIVSDIRKIVYVLLECDIIQQCVRAETATKKVLTWKLNLNEWHNQFDKAKAHVIKEVTTDIHNLDESQFYLCTICNDNIFYPFEKMLDNDGKCHKGHLLQPIDKEAIIQEKQTFLNVTTATIFTITDFENFAEGDASDPESEDGPCITDNKPQSPVAFPLFSFPSFNAGLVDECDELMNLNTNLPNIPLSIMTDKKTSVDIPQIFSDFEYCIENNTSPITISITSPVTEPPKAIVKPPQTGHATKSLLIEFEEEKQALQKICQRFREKFAGEPLTHEKIMTECQAIDSRFLELSFKNMIAPMSDRIDILGEIGAKPITFLILPEYKFKY